MENRRGERQRQRAVSATTRRCAHRSVSSALSVPLCPPHRDGPTSRVVTPLCYAPPCLGAVLAREMCAAASAALGSGSQRWACARGGLLEEAADACLPDLSRRRFRHRHLPLLAGAAARFANPSRHRRRLWFSPGFHRRRASFSQGRHRHRPGSLSAQSRRNDHGQMQGGRREQQETWRAAPALPSSRRWRHWGG